MAKRHKPNLNKWDIQAGVLQLALIQLRGAGQNLRPDCIDGQFWGHVRRGRGLNTYCPDCAALQEGLAHLEDELKDRLLDAERKGLLMSERPQVNDHWQDFGRGYGDIRKRTLRVEKTSQRYAWVLSIYNGRRFRISLDMLTGGRFRLIERRGVEL